VFNLNDMNDDSSSKIPTGFSDESDFVIIMQSVLNAMCNTDYEDKNSRSKLSMSVINIACDSDGNVNPDRSVSVILALLHHITTIIELSEIDMSLYHQAYSEGTMFRLYENPNLPYYED